MLDKSLLNRFAFGLIVTLASVFHSAAYSQASSSERLVIGFKQTSPLNIRTLSAASHQVHMQQLSENVLEINGVNAQFERPFSDYSAVVNIPADSAVQAMNRLRSDPAVEWVEIDRRVFPLDAGPGVGLINSLNPSFSNRFWLHRPVNEQAAGLNTSGMWDNTHGSSDIVVAVLDTGVLFDHPLLQGHLLSGYDFVSESFAGNDNQSTGSSDRDADPSDPEDGTTLLDVLALEGCTLGVNSSWHGSFVAGLVAGNPQTGVGVLPVAWNVSVLPVRVLGRCGGLSTDLADAIRWAAGLSVAGVPNNPTPARIINLSLAAQGGCASNIEGQAIAQARAAGVTVIAAVGNDGSTVDSPANCPGVIGVAAIDQQGLKASYSNFGPEVDLTAPGGDSAFPLWSAGNTGATSPVSNTYRAKIGSSFSTGLVSGVAGAILSVSPTLGPDAVESALKSGTRPFLSLSGRPSCASAGSNTACNCTAATCGAGMLDASLAIAGVVPSDRVNLFSNQGASVPVGSSRVFSVDRASTFTLSNIQKSNASAADPTLSVSNNDATVTMPSGVSGYTLSAQSGASIAAVAVTPQIQSLTTPGLVTGVLDTLNVALVSASGNPSGADATNGTGSDSAAQSEAASSGGGGGGAFNGLLLLIFMLPFAAMRRLQN